MSRILAGIPAPNAEISLESVEHLTVFGAFAFFMERTKTPEHYHAVL
jgi:hypothetical protein